MAKKLSLAQLKQIRKTTKKMVGGKLKAIELKPEPKQYVADTLHTEIYTNADGKKVIGTKPLAVLAFYQDENRIPDTFGAYRRSELAISLKWALAVIESLPQGKETLAEQNHREQELSK